MGLWDYGIMGGLWDCEIMRLWDNEIIEIWDYWYDFWIMVTTRVDLCIAKLYTLVKSSLRIMGNGIMGLWDYGIIGIWDYGTMGL